VIRPIIDILFPDVSLHRLRANIPKLVWGRDPRDEDARHKRRGAVSMFVMFPGFTRLMTKEAVEKHLMKCHGLPPMGWQWRRWEEANWIGP
jgi:hypothetical protein